MSVPQVNSMITSDWPERDTERTERTLRTTPAASSIGREIRFSISVGAAPGQLGADGERRVGQVGQQVDLEPRQRNEPEQGDRHRRHGDGDSPANREVDEAHD